MREFLAEPWWAGVQGIVALVALAAAIVAVIEAVLRVNKGSVRAMSFTTTIHSRVNGIQRVEVTARPMADTTLFEAEWGCSARITEEEEFPPVMRAGDVPARVVIRVPYTELDALRVGVTWVVPRRFGSRTHAARIHVAEGKYEWWAHYWWPYWPRKTAGRWKSPRGHRRPLLEPPSI